MKICSSSACPGILKGLMISLWVLAGLQACEESKKTRSIKSNADEIRFTSPKSGAKFKYGDTIEVSVEWIAQSNKSLESLKVYIENKEVFSSSDPTIAFSYASTDGGGGQVKLKALARFSDGTTTRKRMAIKILAAEKPQSLAYEVVSVLNHDEDAYTQGLYYQSGLIYEGTGNYGRSKILVYDPFTGQMQKKLELADSYFGEGITLLNDTLYQLTYRAQKGLVYSKSLEQIGTFAYDGEGWGLDHDGKHLIKSNGTASLNFIHPNNYTVLKKIQVFDHKGPVYELNELAFVDGFVYANVYTTDRIVKIDAHTGEVIGELDLRGILKKEYITGQIDYLNGIAYRPETQTFFVTGKWWPKLFEIRLKDPAL